MRSISPPQKTLMRSCLSLFNIFFILFSFHSFSQERCGTITPGSGDFELWMESKKITKKNKSQNRANNTTQSVYQIPVVFHVLHNGEAVGSGANISDHRIKQQLETLNEDFRRKNTDQVNTPMIFQEVAADTQIEFVLARQDPQGNPTNGIVRKVGTQNAYNARESARVATNTTLSNEVYWPPEEYLNIYCLNLLPGQLGYSSFPETDLIDGVPFNSADRILDAAVIDYEYLGINPDAAAFPSLGRTLTHELGHFFGLRHIWGDGNCGADDFVEDTPLADNDHNGYGAPCNFPRPNDETCPENPFDAEMFQNYMDYSDDECMNLFTLGQADRMRIVLENSPRRTSLLHSPALEDPIGLFENDISIESITAPLVSSNERPEIKFSILNRGSNPAEIFEMSVKVNETTETSSYTISEFSSGKVTNITNISPQLNPGANVIELTVLSVNGTSDPSNFDNSKQVAVYVDDYSEPLPLQLNSNTIDQWFLASTADTLWENVSNQGDGVVRANGFTNTVNGIKSWLISPVIDARFFNNTALSFEASYGRRTGTNDLLNIQLSLDGGDSYEVIESYNPEQLSDTIVTERWQPEDSSWIHFDVDLNQLDGADNARLAFVFINGNGNDLYLREINLSNYTPAFIGDFRVFPNPATSSSEINIGFNLAQKQPVTLQLIHASGQLISDLYLPNALNQTVTIDTPYANGLYYIRVIAEDFERTEKVIVRR